MGGIWNGISDSSGTKYQWFLKKFVGGFLEMIRIGKDLLTSHGVENLKVHMWVAHIN